MTLKNFKTSSLFLMGIILTLGLSISFQSLLASYTAPLNNPSACLTGNPGCDAPVSTGSTLLQQIQGAMWIVNNASSPYGLIVEQGKVGIGSNTTNINDLVAQLQVTAPAGTEGIRIISAADYSPFVIRNNANSADIFRVDQNGVLQVGSIPWARIPDVPANVTNAISTLTQGTGTSISGTGSSRTITNSAPDQTVVLTQGGATAITGTYPNFTISSTDANWNGGTTGLNAATGRTSLGLDSLSNVTFNSVTATTFTYSDRNLKKNINLIPNALNKVLKLDGVEFNWKKDNRRDLGLIAQDVEMVFPELVKTSETTGLKSLEYGNLVAPLVEAIKEQQKQIEELKVEIENLKNQK
jgi:hypothetical protein